MVQICGAVPLPPGGGGISKGGQGTANPPRPPPGLLDGTCWTRPGVTWARSPSGGDEEENRHQDAEPDCARGQGPPHRIAGPDRWGPAGTMAMVRGCALLGDRISSSSSSALCHRIFVHCVCNVCILGKTKNGNPPTNSLPQGRSTRGTGEIWPHWDISP